MGGIELFLAGVAALAVLTIVTEGVVRVRRATTAARIAEAGTSPFSLVRRVLLTAGAIVGVQWFVIARHADNVTLLCVVLAVPALIASVAVVKTLTVTTINPPRRRAGGGR